MHVTLIDDEVLSHVETGTEVNEASKWVGPKSGPLNLIFFLLKMLM